MNNLPLVSVLVRTCGRPKVLKECLESIRNQTYKNIEICVVEDGKNISEDLIRHKFSDCNIKYKALGQKQGRSVAGNVALEMASGAYFNFLDDDDLFYENHIECMVNEAIANSEESVFYALADEAETEIISHDPYTYETKSVSQAKFLPFSKENLLVHNLFPIQTVFFKREVYEAFGGFRTDLEYLEDWELWLKYAQTYAFVPIHEVTSVYKVPADAKLKAIRNNALWQNEHSIRKIYCEKYIWGKEKPDLSKARQKNSMRCVIDKQSVTDDVFKIDGWCCLKEVCAEETEVYVRVDTKDGDTEIFKAIRYERADIAAKFESEKYLKSGFFLSLDGIKPHKMRIFAFANGKAYYNKHGKIWQKLFGFNK